MDPYQYNQGDNQNQRKRKLDQIQPPNQGPDPNKAPKTSPPSARELALTHGHKYVALKLRRDNLGTSVAFFYPKDCVAQRKPIWYATAGANTSCVVSLLQGMFEVNDDVNAELIGDGAVYCVGYVPTEIDNQVLRFCCYPQKRVDELTLPPLGLPFEANVIRELGPLTVVASVEGRGELDGFALDGLSTSGPLNIDLTRYAREGRHAGHHTIHRLYMMAAFALTQIGDRGRVGLGAGQNIGVILADQSGKILSWGVNTNRSNYTYHGEVNTVQGFLKRGGVVNPQQRYFLYSTLKPCCMCAAFVKKQFGNRITVYFGQNDPGWHANGTQLDGLQRELSFGLFSPKPIKIKHQPVDQDKPGPGQRWVPPNGQIDDLATQLDSSYGTYKGNGKNKIIQYLRDVNTTYLFDCAMGSLSRKHWKYLYITADDYTGKEVAAHNPRAREVVQYLAPFLLRRGIKAFADPLHGYT